MSQSRANVDDSTVQLDQVVFRDMLALSIIKRKYTYFYVELEATKKLLNYLNLNAKDKSRNTTINDGL